MLNVNFSIFCRAGGWGGETVDQKLKLKDTLHFVINAGPAVLIYLEFDIKYPTRSAETTLKFWITLLVFLMWGASKTPLPVLLV